MLTTSSLIKWGAAVLLVSSLTSCEDVLEQYFPKPTPPPTTPTFPNLGLDIPFYTLSGGNKLDAFSTKNPATRTSSVSISGLQNGETLLAIDFRPATGQLYGVSSGSRLYVINQNTGVARAIGSGAFSPAVAGNLVGFDFNPTVDRIRLVTSTGQNLRLNPETGTVAATDGALNGAMGATITGAAYTNNTAGATTTVLYDLDPATDQLYRQDPPNDGTLVPVGALKLNISGDGGFDIDAKTGTALGLYSVEGKPTLFSVNLSTGAAQPLAQYAASASYSGLAIPTQPVAYTTNPNRDQLIIFNPTDPSSVTSPALFVSKLITGLKRNEIVLELDFRPATGQLYALVIDAGSGPGPGPATRTPQLYTINPATAAATLVAPLSIALSTEVAFSMDFNPVLDQLRLITTSGQNLRVNPSNGQVVSDTDIPAAQAPTGIAYTNNFAGATSTSLYGFNFVQTSVSLQQYRSTLYQYASPSENTPVAVGTLDTNRIGTVSMDIGGTSNIAYGLVGESFLNGSFLRRINLQTGELTGVNYYPSFSTEFTLGLGF